MSYWYLATPYSRYPHGTDAAFELACRQAALLLKSGISVFSPIAHTHPIAHYGAIDKLDLNIWLAVDEPMMGAAKGMIMLRAEGWQESKGMAHERAVFDTAGKPIVYMDVDRVPLALATDPRQLAFQLSRRGRVAG